MASPEARGPVALADLPVNMWLVGQETPVIQRRGRYTPHSLHGHPGRMLPEIAHRLITDLTNPGDWILDPLSGVGTTGVEAIHLGRHYVGIELEPRFVAWQEENLKRAGEAGATGRFAVFNADARRFGKTSGRARREAEDDRTKTEHGPIAAVITSPPYGDRLGRWHRHGGLSIEQILRFGRISAARLEPGIYGTSRANIGNLGGGAYFDAMRQVYAGCFAVLKPGGILAVVLQSQRYRQHLHPLHHETARLCQEIGFDFLDEIIALLARVAAPEGEPARLIAHARFWRRLSIARRRAEGFPITLNQVEHILIFQKPLAPPAAPSRPQPKNGLPAALGARHLAK